MEALDHDDEITDNLIDRYVLAFDEVAVATRQLFWVFVDVYDVVR